jgi:hypothetical protein
MLLKLLEGIPGMFLDDVAFLVFSCIKFCYVNLLGETVSTASGTTVPLPLRMAESMLEEMGFVNY